MKLSQLFMKDNDGIFLIINVIGFSGLMWKKFNGEFCIIDKR